MTHVLNRGAQLLQKIAKAPTAERATIVNQMHDLEHEGDTLAHKIFAELSATFVTPFDREDIHVLASALDDVMDYMDGCAARFTLYKVPDCPERMSMLIDILYESIKELEIGVALLRDLRKAEQLQKVLQRVNEFENQADDLFEQAIADLFENEKDPVKIIKLKEIYVGLETATDKCEDAANVLETLFIKHA
jgi:hypothetical protein